MLISYFYHKNTSDMWEMVNLFSLVTSRSLMQCQILTLHHIIQSCVDIIFLSWIYFRVLREGQSFLTSYVKNNDIRSNADFTSNYSILWWYRTFITNILQTCERRSIFSHKLRREWWCKVKYWHIIFFNLVLISYIHHKNISDMWEKVNLFS